MAGCGRCNSMRLLGCFTRSRVFRNLPPRHVPLNPQRTNITASHTQLPPFTEYLSINRFTMDDPSTSETVAEKFGELSPEVLSLLEGMLKIYGIPAEELFFKWESYCIKMGPDDTKLNMDTVLAFKKDVQELFEKEMRSRPRQHGANTSRPVARTPRVKNTGDHVALFVLPMSV